MRCSMCDKENECEYFNILKIPCDDCKYKEQRKRLRNVANV